MVIQASTYSLAKSNNARCDRLVRSGFQSGGKVFSLEVVVANVVDGRPVLVRPRWPARVVDGKNVFVCRGLLSEPV